MLISKSIANYFAAWAEQIVKRAEMKPERVPVPFDVVNSDFLVLFAQGDWVLLPILDEKPLVGS